MATASPESYYATEFFEALRGGEPIARAMAPSLAIAETYGVTPSPALAKLLDFLGTRRDDAKPRLAELFAFAPKDWLPGTDNAFAQMLAEPFTRLALFTGTLPLACTGSGDIWLFTIAPSGIAVYLQDHDTDVVHPIARTLASLAWICRLADATDATPEEWAMVDGDVAGWNDVEVACARTLEDDAQMTALQDANDDLRAALTLGAAYEVGPAKGSGESVHAILANALRWFLRDEDDALDAFVAMGRSHGARIVRDAGTLLTAKRSARGFAARLEALGTVL